jgi:deazaflavin-dependent oxidoreductase (nitroreductase family)
MELNPETEEKLRQIFKRFNTFMLLMWRLGLGSMMNAWPSVSGRILVITHTGRKSRLKRLTPVNYAVVDGELYCTAGFGRFSDWYRNITADPQVEIWLPDGWWTATIEDIGDSEKRLSLMRQVLIGSGIVAPMLGLDPKKLTDEELDVATAKYRLLRIRRREARTGPGGPGDLAWIWPLVTFVLLPLALFRRRRS